MLKLSSSLSFFMCIIFSSSWPFWSPSGWLSPIRQYCPCTARSPKLDTVLRWSLMKGHFPGPLVNTVGHLCCWPHCWLILKLTTRTPRSFSVELLPNSPHPALVHEAIPSQTEDLAIALVGCQEACISLYLQDMELSLNSSALQLNLAFEIH